MGVFFFVCSLALGRRIRRAWVKKGGVLAFIGVHGGLLFLFFFSPLPRKSSFYNSISLTRTGAGGVWLFFLSLVVLVPLGHVYISAATSPARIYLFGDFNNLLVSRAITEST